jgi:transposase
VRHVAIDLGGRESQICIRQPDGTIAEERRVPTRDLPELVATWSRSRVVLETSSEAFRIADAALAAGHEVRVVPATLVKTLGVGSRGVKTDEKDARVLSEVSCRIDVPSVHIPSASSREMKSVCASREVLVQTRTKLVNSVRGWLRTQLWRIRGGYPGNFVDRVRGHAEKLQEVLPAHVERQLRLLDLLTEEIKDANRQVRTIAKESPLCVRLMTVPGVGAITAVRFVAALDQVQRFQSAHAVASYLGLTPGERSSSDSQHRTGITKAGSTALRWTLVQGAWTAMRMCPKEPMVQWAQQTAARRGKFIAVVALARKMAGILFALWRDGTTYRGLRGAQLVSPT